MDDAAAIAIVPPEVRIVGIQSHQAAGVWPLVLPYIQPVLDLSGGAYLAPDVLVEIQRQASQLWVALVDDEPKGVVISSLATHPQLSELNCPIIGGEGMEDWFAPMLATLEAFARSKGCKRIDGVGRRGWGRIVPGMKEVAVVLRKVL